MKQFLVVIAALLACSGQRLCAEDFAAPGGSTVAATAPIGEAEPFLWPVAHVIAARKVKVVSKFGPRKAPGLPAASTTTTGLAVTEPHEGIDFSVPPDAAVRASRGGKVLFAGYSSAYVTRKDKKDKNHLVIIRHSDGKSSRYVHLERLRVKPGTDVKAGDVIGTTSASDEWSETVLHFEIREPNGHPVDPMILLTDPVPTPAP